MVSLPSNSNPAPEQATVSAPFTPPQPAVSTTAASPSAPDSIINRCSTRPATPHVTIPRNGVDYRNKIVLAPMVRSGELPSRLLALHYGADLVWGPETVDRAMIGTTRHINPRTNCIEWTRCSSNGGHRTPNDKEHVIYRIDPTREKGKLIYQIGTSSPTLAVQAAHLVAQDVAGIDVNAGCPKSFSTSSGMGAALLQTPELLASILSALVEQIGRPYEIGISVKIRLLETPQKTESLVSRLCKTGITGLTIHCRTTPMRPRERAIRDELRMIGSICRAHGVACLMNGDVRDRDQGVVLAAEYGVDGGMIATAAESNPSAFRTREQGGLAPWREVVLDYLRLALSVENKWGNTKFFLSQLIPGRQAVHKLVSMAKSHVECLEALGVDEDMMEWGRRVDHILGLDVQVPKENKRKKKKKRQLEEGANGKTQDAESGAKKPRAEELPHESIAAQQEFLGVQVEQIALSI